MRLHPSRNTMLKGISYPKLTYDLVSAARTDYNNNKESYTETKHIEILLRCNTKMTPNIVEYNLFGRLCIAKTRLHDTFFLTESLVSMAQQNHRGIVLLWSKTTLNLF